MLKETKRINLDALDEFGTRRVVKQSTNLHDIGDSVKYLSVVTTGQLLLWADGIGDRRCIPEVVEEGDLVGVEALEEAEFHKSRVSAMRESEVLQIPVRSLELPELADCFHSFVSQISFQIKRQEKRLEWMTKPRRSKEIILLSAVKELYDEDPIQTYPIIAARAGIARESANRTLLKFAGNTNNAAPQS